MPTNILHILSPIRTDWNSKEN